MGKTRVDSAQKAERIDAIRRLKASGATRSDCYAYAAKEWGVASRTCDAYIQGANRQIVEDFSVDRQQYTADLLAVCHQVMAKAGETNQMGAAIAAIAQAAKLARLDS